MHMKILTLIENRCERDDLIAEHGLSLYIEKDNKKILLDTGESGKFIENAKTMGININDIDILVLSHGHYDHVGGVEKFLNENSKAKVYLKSAVKEECYAKRLGISKYIGIDKNILKEHFHRLVFVDKLSEIDKDIFIITDIVKEYSLPEGNKYLYIKENGELKKDDFKHELILVIKEKNGLVMFTGCAHSGILNMIKSVKNNFPKEHIKAVLGGFHLMVIPEQIFLVWIKRI